MSTDSLDARDGTEPLAPFQALLAVFPFLLFGAANIAIQFKIGEYQNARDLVGIILTHPYQIFNWIVYAGLAAGILRDFPRWSFSYLGWAILNTILWANLAYYGQPVNFLLLPFALVLAIPLLVRRSLRPFQPLFSTLRRDLTLPALGLYIFFTSVYMIYDENHHPALLFFLGSSALAATLGAWGYFRSSSPLRRVLALIGGLSLVISLEIINSITWDSATYYGFPPSPVFERITIPVAFWSGISIILFGLGCLAEWIRRRRSAAA